MPALRKCLGWLQRPEPYLALVAAALILAVLDANRSPKNQITSRLYIFSVQQYQRYGRSMIRGIIRCPYRPTCSEYSLGAVRRFGIRKGLDLTVRRLASCRKGVRFGTSDPVPPE
jgi:putative component of membrane protein insertase Oxa1/YidC/SpoIIIJ protein YidD